MSFRFHSNIDRATRRLQENERAALEAVGEFVKGAAKMNAPVDLGNLRGSIEHKVDGATNSVHIGTNTEYALWVEKGTGIYAEDGSGRKGGWVYKDPKTDEFIFTWGNEAQPFLTPAGEDNKQAIKQIFRRYMGDM